MSLCTVMPQNFSTERKGRPCILYLAAMASKQRMRATVAPWVQDDSVLAADQGYATHIGARPRGADRHGLHGAA